MNFEESIAALRAVYPQFDAKFDRILAADAAFDRARSQINPPLTGTEAPSPHGASVGGDLSPSASINANTPRDAAFSSTGDA